MLAFHPRGAEGNVVPQLQIGLSALVKSTDWSINLEFGSNDFNQK